MVKIEDIDSSTLSERFGQMQEEAVSKKAIAEADATAGHNAMDPKPEAPKTAGNGSEPEAPNVNSIVEQLASLGEASATSPQRILASARGLKRRLSRQASQASTPCSKKPRAGDSDDDGWDDDIFNSDMKSCKASVVGSSASAFPAALHASPVKLGTSQASATSPLSPMAPSLASPPKAKAGAKGRGKGGKGDKGEKGQVEILPGHKKCKFCGEILPDKDFAEGKAICSADDTAIESMQRILRKRWGKNNYKTNMKKVKANKDTWTQGIISFRARNQGRKRRVIGGGKDTIGEVKQKVSRKKETRVRRKMTFQAFKIYFTDQAHGGYTEDLLRKKWDELTTSTPPADKGGVVNGVSGHPRWRIPLEDQDDSVSEEEDNDIREHRHEKKGTHKSTLWTSSPFLNEMQICKNMLPMMSSCRQSSWKLMALAMAIKEFLHLQLQPAPPLKELPHLKLQPVHLPLTAPPL